MMTETVEQIKTRVGELNGTDRAELAYFLLSTLEPEEDGVEEAWKMEIARRLTDVRQGRAVGRPVDQVLAEMRVSHP